MKEYFYFPEWTTILDTLLKDIPEKEPFDLFELSKNNPPKIKSEMDFIFESEQTYKELSTSLINLGFADRVNDKLIKLTEEGQLLKKSGSWSKYQKRLRLQDLASYQRLYRDANWLPLTIVGFVITTIVSVLMSIGLSKEVVPQNNTIQLKINLVLPDSTSVFQKGSTVYIHQK